MPGSIPGSEPAPTTPQRLGNLTAALHAAKKLERHAPSLPAPDQLQRKRHLVADLCRLLGSQIKQPAAMTSRAPVSISIAPYAGLRVRLSTRQRQTLARLLAGDAEKEIANQLRVSPNTVHVYVKSLYRAYGVCSRGELLARFVTPIEPMALNERSGPVHF